MSDQPHDSNIGKNLFALLFKSTSQIENELKSNDTSKNQDAIVSNLIEQSANNEDDELKKKISYLLEKIFLITLDNEFNNDLNHPNTCIYIDNTDYSTKYLKIDIIDDLLLKRILFTEINDHDLKSININSNNSDVKEVRGFYYIYQTIKRIKKYKNEIEKLLNVDAYNYLLDLCVNLSKTMIELSEINDSKQLLTLILEFYDTSVVDTNQLNDYLNALFDKFDQENYNFVESLFLNLNLCIKNEDYDFFSSKFFYFVDLLIYLTARKEQKLIFLKTCFPTQQQLRLNGKYWQTGTLLGKLLTPHFLPSDRQSTYHFLQKPIELTQRDLEINQNNMWQRQQQINEKQIQMFKHFLLNRQDATSGDVRSKLMEWIGECIYVNRNKAQEWSKFINQNDLYASDGFFLNLLIILLDLSQPFCKLYSESLLKIDITYSLIETPTGSNVNTVDFNKIHIKGFDKETKLLKYDENITDLNQNMENFQPKTEYTFITECFYATQKCFQLAFVNLYQKLMKLNQDLGRTQSTYEELRQQFQQNETFEPIRHIRNMYEKQTTEFLNIKIALTQINLIEMSIKFLSSTSTWFIYLCTCDNYLEQKMNDIANKVNNFENKILLESKNSLNRYLLSHIPEFFLINLNEFLIFLSRFQDSSIDLIIDQLSDVDNESTNRRLNPFMLIILLLMGNSDYVFNPHCRAQLAECLEALLPTKNSRKANVLASSSYIKQKRELLFNNKICYNNLSEALLNVFVSIEMSGQSVQFEQKFNYRRPMYEILEYIWTINAHKNRIKELAHTALENIENVNQPLFLRFINLLINDATYLLVEGLLYLEKIKQKQEELEQFSARHPNSSIINNNERNQLESGLKHLIMLAKFHNIMSTKTLHAFRLLTSEIEYFFCEISLVDRVATMLNDFLLHLVGSKRKNLKVHNFKEVEFNPQDIVSTICDIYLNLGVNEEFCKAVCRDGRSYSKELFPLAEDVLNRINRPPDMIEKFHALGFKIEEISRIQQIEDSNYDDAPDEFLDEILSILMVDPVILPSSRKVVDRSTISRHLLSDQTDPFNRMPLTLQEVIPATEIKQRIEEWKASKRANSKKN